MLLYVTLGTNDLERAGAFYDRTLATLGLKRRKEDAVEIGYGAEDDFRCRLWIVRRSTARRQPSATARW